MRKISWNMGHVIAALALFITTCNVNSTCVCIVHQPKVPEKVMKLRKK